MKNKVTDTELARILWQITRHASEQDITERVRAFVHYLHTHAMLHRGERVVACFTEVARQQEGGSELILESAEPLSKEIISEIQHTLSLTDASVVTKENPAILAGVIAHVNGVVYDMSITKQLQRLTEQLVA